MSEQQEDLTDDLGAYSLDDENQLQPEDTLVDRIADLIGGFSGSMNFVFIHIVWFTAWFLINTGVIHGIKRFDPYPFIFLTLILSLQASYAAPLILLAQNRQDDRDRIQNELDRSAAERNQADVEYLTREIAALRIALGEVATRDYIRSELQRLQEELQEPYAPSGAPRSGETG